MAPVAQQAHLPVGDAPGLPLQCEPLVADGEVFLLVGAEQSERSLHDLVPAVRRRYGVNGRAAWQLANRLVVARHRHVGRREHEPDLATQQVVEGRAVALVGRRRHLHTGGLAVELGGQVHRGRRSADEQRVAVGEALAAASAAKVPLAPGSFFTTRGWPSAGCMASAISRSRKSEDPPRAAPTTGLIGLAGSPCARALPASAAPNSARLAPPRPGRSEPPP
jgi:hypothetical protein